MSSLRSVANTPRREPVVKSSYVQDSFLPAMTAQLSDKALWGFVIIGVVVAAVCIFIFVQAEKDNGNELITTNANGTLNALDNIPLVSIVGTLGILSSAYASYRAYKSYEGDAEATAKQGMVGFLFVANVFLTAVWFNSFYVSSAAASDPSQTPTAAALGIALTSGLLVAMFWQSDRVCAGMAAFNCVLALVGAWISYRLRDQLTT